MVEFLAHLQTFCENQPAAPALDDGKCRLSYGELWLQLGLLAAHIPRDRLVGLALPRSIDFVQAVLACWWAGSAFVPLDPSLPPGRRQALKAAAQPDLIWEQLPPLRGEWLEPQAASDLAYVIGTSGSSGTPKAVEITPAGLVSMLQQQISAFQLGPGKRMGWMLSVQFDASLSDIGCALLSGACLCPAPAGVAVNLPLWLQQQHITHLDIPPALLRHYQPGQFPASLETLVAGGEASPPEILRQWSSYHRLISVYGPTEATICTSLAQVGPDWDGPRLGLALTPMQHLEVEGELYIAGPGLARGYRGRPDLTGESFVEYQGQRCYRSGDQVVALGDGDFRFLGRKDRQVKIAGHRLQLEEVESLVLQVEGVERCWVQASDEQLSLHYQGGPCPQIVREWLLSQLPQLLVPWHLQQWEQLPLGESGKVDPKPLQLWQRYLLQGLDSLGALELASQLQAQGYRLTPAELLPLGPPSPDDLGVASRLPLGPPSPDDLGVASRLPLGPPSSYSTQSLRQEVQRLPLPNLASRLHQGRRWLLTGATGHLGGQLLARLCPDHACWCLARDPAQLPVHPNIHPIQGDLTQPEVWRRLPPVDAIFHCAAQVNNVLSFQHLRPVNLDCLPYLLEYAARGEWVKPIHFASTLSVFVASDFVGEAREADELEDSRRIYGGYAQSKVAAELYLRRWAGPVSYYRYGLLVDHPRHDFVKTFLRGIQSMGCYPRGLPVFLDMTPIDFAAQATWELLRAHPSGGTFHIANHEPVSLGQLLAPLRLKSLEAEEFFARPAQTHQEAAAQLALCRLHPDPEFFARYRSLDLFQATQVSFELKHLEALGLRAPAGVPDCYGAWPQ